MALLDELRDSAMAKPGATEDYPWGHIVWKVRGKLFAITSDPADRLAVCATLDAQSALIQDPAIVVASHIGRYGWVTIDLADPGTHGMAFELMDGSYNLVVSKMSKKA